MRDLQFTLVTDGTSDAGMLTPILEWLLRAHCNRFGVGISHADVARCRIPPRGLANRIRFALEAYPCDALFVHRDAERDPPESRHEEIRAALDTLSHLMTTPRIHVVPVRMTEAWLLIDEMAIRRASDNPNGKVRLDLPQISRLEDQPDPKHLLHELLKTASEKQGRRLRAFDPRHSMRRIAQLIEDFSPLRKLSAFRRLESDVQYLVAEKGWGSQSIAQTTP